MLEIEHDKNWQTGCIILRPHPPISWQANVGIVIATAFLALSSAIGFAFAGAWLILPFAGAEVLALYFLLYYVSLKARVQEVVQFSDTEVRVQRGRRLPISEWSCHRFWCRLHVYTPWHPWYSKRVRLRCHANEVELGNFLSDEEKKILIRELKAFLSHD